MTAAFAQEKAADTSPHRVRMVTVDKGVTLEVLDWGGNGRAVIFLAGMGDTAHVFDELAPKLTGEGHIYGITRRGFGASSAPLAPVFDQRLRKDKTYDASRRDPGAANAYDSDRLGDDILAVIDQLQLDRPVLVGHSIAGAELSSIGSRHPEKVVGLVYLDALSFYAFFSGPESEIPLKGPPPWPVGPNPMPEITLAVLTGVHKYTSLPVPVLGIVPFPRKPPPGAENDPAIAARHAAATEKEKERLASLEHDIPTAHIVRLPYGDHYIWRTNEADVLRELSGFLSKLR
jgi:non-heme chloroperoxidase